MPVQSMMWLDAEVQLEPNKLDWPSLYGFQIVYIPLVLWLVLIVYVGHL